MDIKKGAYILCFTMAILALCGCSREKDTFTSRTYNQMISKFNPLFNGQQALLKGENTLNTSHKDNYEEILPVYKLGDEELANTIKPDMDRVMEKGTKVIHRYSMDIKNNQKNRYIDDSYVLIGKARFYNRQYTEALETFNYVIQEFKNSKAYYEAILWGARCKTKLGNYLSAKDDFDKIYRSKKLPEKLKADVYASYAQLHLDQNNYTAAYQLLQLALDNTRKKEKEIRWLFICGQLQSKLENYYEASELFKKVIKKGPPYEFLFQAQLNRARNYDVLIEDPQKVFDELDDMLKDEKNLDNRDQIYYVLAEIYERLEDEAMMEESLKKSLRVSTTNSTQKGLSYLKLGEMNFDNKLYVIAEAYYDSTLQVLPEKHKRFEQVSNIKESLTALVENLNIIETQDSLLQLASLSKEDLLVRIEKHIKNLEEEDRRKEEEAEKAEDPFENFAFNTASRQSEGGGTSTNGQWYFYNTNLRSSGLTLFRNKWGARKLEDNWRRKDKALVSDLGTLSTIEEGEDIADSTTTVSRKKQESKYKVQDFVKGIPLTDEAKEEAKQKIIKAYFALGRIYKESLKDYQSAGQKLEELLTKYPNLEEKGKAWYSLYRIFLLDENQPKADYYKGLILNQLPESEFAQLIINEGSEVEDADEKTIENFYVQTYGEYTSKSYRKSLRHTEEGIKKYPKSEYAPKFQILKAFNIAKLKKKPDFVKELKAVIALFPNTEEAKEANAILAQIDKAVEMKREGEEEKGEKSRYSGKLNQQHRYILLVPNKGVDVNGMRNKLSDFNKKFFSLDKLRTKTIFLSSNEQMILVSDFANSTKAEAYYKTLINQKTVSNQLGKVEYKHFVISNENFQTFYQAKDAEEYLKFFQKNYLK